MGILRVTIMRHVMISLDHMNATVSKVSPAMARTAMVWASFAYLVFFIDFYLKLIDLIFIYSI